MVYEALMFNSPSVKTTVQASQSADPPNAKMRAMMSILTVMCLLTSLHHAVARQYMPSDRRDDDSAQSTVGISTHDRLRISAVVHDSSPPHDALLECWELRSAFVKYPTVGSALHLADVSNLTYVTLPPRSKEGLHHPPHPMFFILLTGMAHVRLPSENIHDQANFDWSDTEDNGNGQDGLWIIEGVNPVIAATDVLGIGHYTDYPGKQKSVALQAPFKHGVVPAYQVVGKGPCEMPEGWTDARDRLSGQQDHSVVRPDPLLECAT